MARMAGLLGAPLVPSIRPEVKPRQLAGGAGQINTAVPAQKLQMYTGTELQTAVKARANVTAEVGNMVESVANAGIVIHEAGEKKKQLEIEGEYKRFTIDKQNEFKEQRTAKDKARVRNEFEIGIAKLNAKIKGHDWGSLQEKAWAQGLAIEGKRNLADLTTKWHLAEHTETVSAIQTNFKENQKDFATRTNIDPMLHMDQGIKMLEDLYDMKHISKEQLLAGIREYKNTVTLNRASLLATNYAKEIDPANVPSPEQLLIRLQQEMGIPFITDDLLEVTHEKFKTEFLKEIQRRNKMDSFEEILTDLAFKEARDKNRDEISQLTAENALSLDDFSSWKSQAQARGDDKFFRELETLETEWVNNRQANSRITNYWGTPEGDGYRYLIQQHMGDKGFIDVEEAVKSIRTQSENDPQNIYSTSSEVDMEQIRMRLGAYNTKLKNQRIDKTTIAPIFATWLMNKVSKRGTDRTAFLQHLVSKNLISEDVKNTMSLNADTISLNKYADDILKYSTGLSNQAIQISEDIAVEMNKTRDGEGLYSKKGFRDPEWIDKYRQDVERRFEEFIGMSPATPINKSNSLKTTQKTKKSAVQLTPKVTPKSTQNIDTTPTSTSLNTDTKNPTPMPSSEDQANLEDAKTVLDNSTKIVHKNNLGSTSANKIKPPTEEQATNALIASNGDVSQATEKLNKQFQPKKGTTLELTEEDFEDEETTTEKADPIDASLGNLYLKNIMSQFETLGDVTQFVGEKAEDFWNWETEQLSILFSKNSIDKLSEFVRPHLVNKDRFIGDVGLKALTFPYTVADSINEIANVFDKPITSNKVQNQELEAYAKQKFKDSGIPNVPKKVTQAIQIMSDIGATVQEEIKKTKLILRTERQWAGKGGNKEMKFKGEGSPLQFSPVTQANTENQMFDPSVVKQVVTPIVEEVTKAVQGKDNRPISEQILDDKNLAWLLEKYGPQIEKMQQLRKVKDTRVRHETPTTVAPINLKLPISKQTDRQIWDRATELYQLKQDFDEWGVGKDQTKAEAKEYKQLQAEIKKRKLTNRKMSKK